MIITNLSDVEAKEEISNAATTARLQFRDCPRTSPGYTDASRLYPFRSFCRICVSAPGISLSSRLTNPQNWRNAIDEIGSKRQRFVPPMTATADESILREFEPIHAGAAGG